MRDGSEGRVKTGSVPVICAVRRRGKPIARSATERADRLMSLFFLGLRTVTRDNIVCGFLSLAAQPENGVGRDGGDAWALVRGWVVPVSFGTRHPPSRAVPGLLGMSRLDVSEYLMLREPGVPPPELTSPFPSRGTRPVSDGLSRITDIRMERFIPCNGPRLDVVLR